MPLREDFGASALQLLTRNRKDAARARRPLHKGGSARGGMTLQIGRGWVIKFNAPGPT